MLRVPPARACCGRPPTAAAAAAGVILFVMLAGFLPFDEPSMSNLFDKILQADFHFPEWYVANAKAEGGERAWRRRRVCVRTRTARSIAKGSRAAPSAGFLPACGSCSRVCSIRRRSSATAWGQIRQHPWFSEGRA